jgi:parallel beta-helix repeat protein
MVRHAVFAFPLGILLAAAPAGAADYYVAPGGSGTTCSMAAPCGRVEDAQTRAAAGDTVWVRGGTFTFAANALVGVAFSKSGQQNNRINYFAYQNEIPIFDLSNGQPSNRVTGFDVTASWIHVRGMEVRGVQQYASGEDSWGVRLRGSNNIIERLNVHHNEAPGIFITSGANNLILNCDSHHNYDQLENGGSGDGFGCHSTGAGNVMRRWLRLHQRARSLHRRAIVGVSQRVRARHDDRGGKRRRFQGRRLRLASLERAEPGAASRRPAMHRLRKPRARLLREPPPGWARVLEQSRVQKWRELQHADGHDVGSPAPQQHRVHGRRDHLQHGRR